jgi:hypothetical protein
MKRRKELTQSFLLDVEKHVKPWWRGSSAKNRDIQTGSVCPNYTSNNRLKCRAILACLLQ